MWPSNSGYVQVEEVGFQWMLEGKGRRRFLPPLGCQSLKKCLWEGKIIFDPYNSAEPPSKLTVSGFYSLYILRLGTACARELSLQLPQAAVYSRNTLINPLYFNCPVPDSSQQRRQERQINTAQHPAAKDLF